MLLHTPLILKHSREDIHVDIIYAIGIIDAVRSGAHAVRSRVRTRIILIGDRETLTTVAAPAATVARDGIEELLHADSQRVRSFDISKCCLCLLLPPPPESE